MQVRVSWFRETLFPDEDRELNKQDADSIVEKKHKDTLNLLSSLEDSLTKESQQMHSAIQDTKQKIEIEKRWLCLAKSHWDRTGELMYENAHRNLSIPRVNTNLLTRYYNKEFMIISFGASLRHTIHKILTHRDDRIIMCVDVSAAYLLRHGIKPDIIVTLDIHAEIENIPSDCSDIILLAYIAGNNEYIRIFAERGGTIIYYNLICAVGSDIVWDTLAECSMFKCRLGGHVGGIAISIANDLLNAKRMYLFGSDFCYDEYFYPEETVIDYMKRIHLTSIDGEGQYMDINNRVVKSYPTLLNYIFHLYEYMKDNILDQKLYNCSEEGMLRIPKTMPIEMAVVDNII